jgi:hypothetical protein
MLHCTSLVKYTANVVLYLTTIVKYRNVEERRTTLSVGVTPFTTMAEWGQLLAGPPSPHAALERGHWYPVEARTKDGVVWEMGANAVGRPVAESLVRIINHEPEKVTRVRVSSAFSRSAPARAHLLRRLSERTSDLPVAYRRFKR